MIFYDCLYGEIHFKRRIIRCILTPEMQRLREVRLGNINSISITGSMNINRYEHSIGTAYLAMTNVDANKKTFPKEKKDTFVLAALFHDIANGPFGHSYEYIVEKQGFIPEKGILNVIIPRKGGAYGKKITCEPFYMGEPNEIGSILSKKEIVDIDKVVRGEDDTCSRILSDGIDIDNIDNVYRMAYHMGIDFDRTIPVELAKGIVCLDGEIFFKASAIPYLYNWYDIRSQVYQMLLYNPQDISAKCMLTDVMDMVLEHKPNTIKWHFTDSELIDALRNIEEIWEERYIPLSAEKRIKILSTEKKQITEEWIREVFSVEGISIPYNARMRISIEGNRTNVSFYNTDYCIEDGRVFKLERMSCNNTNIIKRLMRGDLYDYVGIITSNRLDKAELFLDYKSRCNLEVECNVFLKQRGICDGDTKYSIGFHCVVDSNKTNRQLEINMLSGERFTIGQSSSRIIIGILIKNAVYGLANRGGLCEAKKRELYENVCMFMSKNGINNMMQENGDADDTN